MVEDFSESVSPEEILRKVAGVTQRFPGVRAIRLLCQEESPDSIVCVIEANQQSWALAGAIGGHMYGEMPARTIAPLPPGFRCEGRSEGVLISRFCAKCYVTN